MSGQDRLRSTVASALEIIERLAAEDPVRAQFGLELLADDLRTALAAAPPATVLWTITPSDAALVCEALRSLANVYEEQDPDTTHRLDNLSDQLDGLCS